MYIPSVDMGEYDDYSGSVARSSRLPPTSSERERGAGGARQLDRQSSRKKLEHYSRIPRWKSAGDASRNSSHHYSGYFIVDDESEVESESPSKTTRIPIRRENSQSRIPIRRENSQSRLPLRREASQSSLYSSPQAEEGPERSRTLPRQGSRARLPRQESRGSLRRQQSGQSGQSGQSATRLTHR